MKLKKDILSYGIFEIDLCGFVNLKYLNTPNFQQSQKIDISYLNEFLQTKHGRVALES